ncbi:MAG: hypothetical protein FJW40_17705 [Acidobacteria bacterium]|nr:hypothetical protein [Acidobacteriota bacterium]
MTPRRIIRPAGLIIAVGMAVTAAQAADPDPPGKASVFYRTSIVAFAAGHTLDAASSWKRVYEGNPLLRSTNGQFAGKGLAIKSGLAAGAVAVHNWRLGPPR